MAKQSSSMLFQLVQSMTKAEKRNFKLYANRNNNGRGVLKFVQLFDALDQMHTYDEAELIRKLPQLKKRQFSNLKRHLYQNILASLRMLHIQKNIDIELREQIDYARILYNKGLYLQSLKLLEKAKNMAFEHHQDLLHLEILEFEKKIESRHITRSMSNRAATLSEEATQRLQAIRGVSKLTNLSLQLYGTYIRIGHVRNAQDIEQLGVRFETVLARFGAQQKTFFEKIYLCQAYVWYYYILLDFVKCYRYAQKWVDTFKQSPSMMRHDTDLFMRGYHNLLSVLYQLGYASKLAHTLTELEVFCKELQPYFSETSELLAFTYIYTARFNKHFLEGRFAEGLAWLPAFETRLARYDALQKIDQHRIMVFYYKIACLHFSLGDNDTALDYLNRIIQSQVGALREDIQCYARMLHLIAHYELGHHTLLESLVKSVYRFLTKMKDLNAVQREVLRFLRKALYHDPQNMKPLFVSLREALLPWTTHPYERRSFLYLDIIAWLESKIHDRPVEVIIQEKYTHNKR